MSLPINQSQVIEFAEKGKIRNGKLVLPTLYSINKYSKYLLWTIHVGIVIPTDDDEEDEQIDVTQDYIDREELPDEAVGIYWAVSGQEGGKVRTSDRTYIYEGKNPGKKNFTTPFTQAILEARSIYNKRVRKGNKTKKEQLKLPGETTTIADLVKDRSRGDYPWRVFAMALHSYDKFRGKIKFPAYIQPKLDGTLYIVIYHPAIRNFVGDEDEEKESDPDEAHIDGYSRGREDYGAQRHIPREILPIAKQYPGLHFVGELWKQGYSLQQISGSSRRKADSKMKTEAIKLNFNIFDCFYIDKPKLGFEERMKILDEVMQLNKSEYIDRVPTGKVTSHTEVKKLCKTYLAEGMEGAVVRNTGAPYEFGLNKEARSYQTLKKKPRPDAEWPIVGFSDGRGKRVGLVIWTCAENDEGVENAPDHYCILMSA